MRCQAYDPSVHSSYGYRPSLAAGITFVVLFSLSFLLHSYQAIRLRSYWLLFFVFGALWETVGWVTRIIAWSCPYNFFIFKFQFAVLIFSPAFIQAGIYVILYATVALLGQSTSPLPSRITPKVYLIIFGIIDIICLTFQAVGGALAGAASGTVSTKPGTHTMVVGIISQLVSTIIFSVILSKVILNGWVKIYRNRYLLILSAAAFLGVILMITRGVYRSVELLQGWTGHLITHEKYAVALDGTMMVLASWTFNVCNPKRLIIKAGQEMEREVALSNQNLTIEIKDSEGMSEDTSVIV